MTVNTRRTGTALAPRLKADHPSNYQEDRVEPAAATPTYRS
ncbi:MULTISPECIES: hypothetical protein [Kribbella]|nr:MULTISPECIES: hypothetical protein [Kribbella]